MFLIMCKTVLKFLDWQKESYQIIVLVTDLYAIYSEFNIGCIKLAKGD